MRHIIVEDNSERIQVFKNVLPQAEYYKEAYPAVTAIRANPEQIDVLFLDHDYNNSPFGNHGKQWPEGIENSGSGIAWWLINSPQTHIKKIVVHSRNLCRNPVLVWMLQKGGYNTVAAPFNELFQFKDGVL